LFTFSDFFIDLEKRAGSLTLHSTIRELVSYVQAGLRLMQTNHPRPEMLPHRAHPVDDVAAVAVPSALARMPNDLLVFGGHQQRQQHLPVSSGGYRHS
jgi:hypothetical protein